MGTMAGLLAGLHEFPTEPNVGNGLSASAMQQIPQKLLSTLLRTPPQPYGRTAGERQTRAAAAPFEELRIAHIRPAGDVVHVFSHIRKTYRVQWVLLEGGGCDVPPLAPQQSATGGPAAVQKKGKRGSKQAEPSPGARATPSSPPTAPWKALADVPEAK